MISVCFTGHRLIPGAELESLTARLDETLAQLYRQGYRIFYSGGALGLDQLAAERVLLLRETHGDARLIMALPCADQTDRWERHERARLREICDQADETITLAPHYYSGCMMVRNRYLVSHAACCVCYLTHMKGGTASTVAYALSRKVPVINLAMRNPSSSPSGGTKKKRS